MLCQHCNKNEATTYVKKNINGQKEEMHLCSECAKELGVMDEFKMPTIGEMFGDTFLGNFLGAGVAAMNSLAGVDRCQTCGASFNDIVKSGRLGCSDCYSKFEDKLDPSIRKIHGKTKHVGKYVSYTEEEEPKKAEKTKESELDSLKAQLKDAVKEQRFEDAAVIRDKINSLTEGNNE
ncbi:MAG: UvrB/UvrC motif-containing protein [Clostridiales bacterium]|nr:UvrB/UvrC motif-containing protein [Clostridiales bacterium]